MSTGIVVRLVFWLWFAAAVTIGYQRGLARLPAAAVPAILLGLTGLLLTAYFRWTAFRVWLDALDLRALIALHLSRFVGIYFLVLYREGELPRDFAVPGGVGDIIVAALALPLVFAPLEEEVRLRAQRIWNVIGLLDILFVVATAIRLNVADPAQLHALTRLPLSLLPTLLVPLIIASHIVIFLRLTPRAT
jgi:hypothetical protein